MRSLNHITIKVMVLFVAMAFMWSICETAFAESKKIESQCADKQTSISGKDKWHLHSHCYEDTDTDTHLDRKSPVGVGIDVPLYVADRYVIVNENKFDLRNDEYSNYTVVRIGTDVGLLQSIGEFFKDLFN